MTDHLSLVALAPSDVPAQQAQLVAWCDQTLRSLRQDVSDNQDNQRIAVEHARRRRAIKVTRADSRKER